MFSLALSFSQTFYFCMDSGLCTVGGDVATDAMLSPHLIYLLRSKTLSLRSSLTKLGQVGCVLVYGGTLSVPTVVNVVAKQRATRSD